jgi:hypothetical protein
MLTIRAMCFDFSSTATLRKTTLKCKVIKVTLYRVSFQCRSEMSVLQKLLFILFNPMTLLFLCLLHGGNIVNKKEYLRIKLNWRSEKYFGFSLESTMGSHIPRYISCIVHRSFRNLNLLSDIFTITQCDKRLRLWNAKCMRRYKTNFKKFNCQWKNLVTGSQRLYELPYLCMKLCHEV